jgi:hypothetical protein
MAVPFVVCAQTYFTKMADEEVGVKHTGKEVFKAKQVVEFRGIFSDETDAGVALGVVVRVIPGKNTFLVRFVEAADEGWGHHLVEREDAPIPTFVRLMQKWGDSNVKKIEGGNDIEWVTAWRILAEANEDDWLEDVPWLKSPTRAIKNIAFAREWMCSEKVSVQATSHLSIESNFKKNKWEPVGEIKVRLVGQLRFGRLG